jgi:hypothetical protein
LAKSSWNRDDDIPQHLSGDTKDRRSSFSRRKREHVGAAILATEAVIKAPHPPIAHQRYSELGGGLPDEIEYSLCQPQDALTTKPY